MEILQLTLMELQVGCRVNSSICEHKSIRILQSLSLPLTGTTFFFDILLIRSYLKALTDPSPFANLFP